MAMKCVIESLEDVPEALREHYTPENGKFVLATQGELPKIKEFRNSNVELTRERDSQRAALHAFEGLDPAKVRADLGRLAELDKIKPAERIATLEAQISEMQSRTETAEIERLVSDAFLKSGGRPNARAFIVQQAAGLFTLDKGELKGKKFSADRPGEPISLAEWLTLQSRDNGFAWLDSSGGGARPARGNAGGSARILQNPSPQDLGRYSKEIASGEMKVSYE
jgi:hypothetical protein